jgi:hypothetical protein
MMAKRKKSYELKEVRLISFIESEPPVFVINVFYGTDPFSYRIVRRVKAEEPHLKSEWDIFHVNGPQRMKPVQVLTLTGNGIKAAYAHGLLYVMGMAETANEERVARVNAELAREKEPLPCRKT